MAESKSISLKGQSLLIKKKKLNLILNIIIAFMGVTSLALKFFVIDGVLAFRAFTVDGNLFTTIVTIAAVFVNIKELRTKRDSNNNVMYYLLLASAVTEAVIFIVVMIGYLPFVPDKPAVTPYHMFCLHVGIPILSVLRFIFFERPVGILKPQKILLGAIPIGVYGLGVSIAIKSGILPVILVPYSFLDFDNNFIWYFLFALFVIPSFGYLWSWMFYRLNLRTSVLWYNETDIKNLEKERIKSMSRFDNVNTGILLIYCMMGLLLLTFSLMSTSKTSTQIQHEMLSYVSFYMIDDCDHTMGDGKWNVKDGVLYKGTTVIGDGTEANANYDILTSDKVIFESSIYVKANKLSPEIAKKYGKDDYVCVLHSAGKNGPADVTGDVLSEDIVKGVEASQDADYYKVEVIEKEIKDPLYESEYRKYFEEEKKDRQKFYRYCIAYGEDGIGDKEIGIMTLYIPVTVITAQAKENEINADLSMFVIVVMIFSVLYIITMRWIKALEKSIYYLRELADDKIPDEPLQLGKGSRMNSFANWINKLRKKKIASKVGSEENDK